jgi:adenine/guanine/hypoxanthine permease
MLNKFFQLEERKTNIPTEIIAGLTTFITMAYILAVMPAILAKTGMDRNAVFIDTALASCIVCCIMGIFVNWPIALAPAMGYNVYFASIAAQQGGIVSWQVALGLVFISGIIMIALTATKFRKTLIAAIPESLKHGIIVGVGLFITIIGLKMAGIVTVGLHPETAIVHSIANLSPADWDFTLGKLSNPSVVLSIIGIIITAALMAKNMKGAILVSIIITTLIGIPLGITQIHNFSFTLPSFHHTNFGALNIKDIWHLQLASIIFSLTLIALLDTFGTLISATSGTTILDKSHHSPMLGRALLVDSIGITIGAWLGVSTMTAYLESTTGIRAGGKTGLTAVVVGILFLLAIIFAPFFQIIPNEAVAPALVVAGLFMLSSVTNINFNDFTESFPAFLTMIIMPLTNSITYGMGAGIVFYTFLKIATGQFRQLHWMMYVLAILVIANYLFSL